MKGINRRNFFKVGIAGLSAAAVSGRSKAAIPHTSPEKAKVQYSELLPHEFRKRIAAKPIAYLPLGTIEWHGEHLALGSDAIQSEGLMVECARRFGGVVFPPIHLGPDRVKIADNGQTLIGMDNANSTMPNRKLDGSCYWVSDGLHLLIVDGILTQLKRAGFRAVLGDGHGPSRWSWVEHIPERETRFGLKLFGVTEDIGKEWQSQKDHAALNETSIMMYLRPELVDLSQLPESRDIWPQGVAGKDPRDASPELGKECLEKTLEVIRRKFTEAGLL